MPNVNIEDKLYRDIKDYCKINGLTINTLVNNLLRKNFTVEKYDDAPPFFKKIKEEFTPEQFQQEYAQEFKIEREKYIKPEIAVEEIPVKKELTAKEKARQRVQYL
jgi:predicted transcriptional regulator